MVKSGADLQDLQNLQETAVSYHKHRCDLKNVQMSWSGVMGYELVANSAFPLFVGLTWLSGEKGLSSKV